MRKALLVFAGIVLAAAGSVCAQDGPPRGNPYDVISRIFQPFVGVLLTETTGKNRAAEIELEMVEVGGRLPKEMEGAVFKGSVEFPDKVRLEAPVMGETFTVCRNGDAVWATPGEKVEFLLSKFEITPKNIHGLGTPVYLPITPQQAIFLPALFSVARPDVAEVDELRGESCRVVSVKLMPVLAEALEAQDFEAVLWIGPGHRLRRVEVSRKDFTATVDVRSIVFRPSLPENTWEPPKNGADVHRTNLAMLDGLFYILMNSLRSAPGSEPWLTAK